MHMTQDLLQIQPSDRNKNYAHSKTHHDPIQRRTQLDISTLFKHKSPLKSPMRKYQRQIATCFLSSVQQYFNSDQKRLILQRDLRKYSQEVSRGFDYFSQMVATAFAGIRSDHLGWWGWFEYWYTTALMGIEYSSLISHTIGRLH